MAIRIALTLFLLSSPAWAQSVTVGGGASETVGAGAEVLASPSGVEVQNGGILELAGADNNRGRLAGPSTGVTVAVLSGGTIDFKFGVVVNVTTLTVSSGGKIQRLQDTEFTDQGLSPGVAPWIDISALNGSDRANLPFSVNRVKFADPQGSPSRLTIKSSGTAPILRVLGNSSSHGNRWGEDYDFDDFGRVLWHTGAVSRSGGSTFDTIEEARVPSSPSRSARTLSSTNRSIGTTTRPHPHRDRPSWAPAWRR
jgi:hypothetical protein